MSYTVEITKNNMLALPDALCEQLGFNMDDILICELDKTCSEITMKKHADQKLTDEQILATGNLTRVIHFTPDE